MTDQEIKSLKEYDLRIIIERYINSQGTETNGGSMYNCPFPNHDDQHKSFGVKYGNDGWYYNCFGCRISGDIFTFLGLAHNLDVQKDFIDIAKIASQLTGIPITTSSKPVNPAHQKYKDEMKSHMERYESLLHGPDGIQAKEYLMSRGIAEDTMKLYKLGYIPRNEKSYRKDFPYYNKVSFPIMEHTRSVETSCPLGFAYGKFDTEDPSAKYINDATLTGELENLFIKGNMFYGFPQAFDSIKQLKSVIIVEGYIDVLSLAQSGIRNVLGCMTSGMTDNAIDTLSNLCDNIILFLDNDESGSNGNKTCCTELLKLEKKVKVFVPKYIVKDAGDLCSKHKFQGNVVLSILERDSINGPQYLVNDVLTKVENRIAMLQESALDVLNPIIDLLGRSQSEIYRKQVYSRLGL